MLESTLADRKDAVKARKPDLTRTLEMIKFLKKKNVCRCMSVLLAEEGFSTRRSPKENLITSSPLPFAIHTQEAGESFETTFKLSHNVQCEAEIDATTDKVLLWLGVCGQIGFSCCFVCVFVCEYIYLYLHVCVCVCEYVCACLLLLPSA